MSVSAVYRLLDERVQKETPNAAEALRFFVRQMTAHNMQATPAEWRAAYESKVEDFARETLRASRLRAALDALDALNPDDFRTGQGHIPAAFREVNYRAAIEAVAKIVDAARAADAATPVAGQEP